MNRHPHLINAAAILLSVCFLIITTLKYTHMGDQTNADELALLAACFFLGCIAISLMATVRDAPDGRHDVWPNRTFLAGGVILIVSTLTMMLQLH